MKTVTLQGNTLHLVGDIPTLGSKLKSFKLLTPELVTKTDKDYTGKVLMILTVPSLDTPVCDMEVRKFNKEAASLSTDIKILSVSTDLPFAQARCCTAAGISAVDLLSDHFSATFGEDYGVLIKELRLLARAVFVYNKSGELVYLEILSDVSSEPNYNAAIEAAKKAI